MSQSNPNKPLPKRMMLYCEPCGFKQIIEPSEEPLLPEIKSSPIQARLPTIDTVTGKPIHVWALDENKEKIVNPQMKPQPKKYKCPSCGRGVKLRELIKPFAEALQQRDEAARKLKEQEEIQKRIEDGKPEKKIDPNFTG